LVNRHGDAFRRIVLTEQDKIQPALLLFVGDEQLGGDTPHLKDGDVITILAPMAGG
jgi:molybdopterin converting factor small subunit